MTVPNKLTFAVAGLGCDGCVAAIENAVMPMPGVTYVGVSLSGGTMTIRPGPGLDIPQLKTRVSDLGYSMSDGVPPTFLVASVCPCRTRGR